MLSGKPEARAEIVKTQVEIAKLTTDMRPNSGSSMRDAINRTEKRVSELGKSVGGIRDDMRLLREEVLNIQESETACRAHVLSHLRKEQHDGTYTNPTTRSH